MAQQQQTSGTGAGGQSILAGAKTSPRKFSEKIALLYKKEAEGTAEFEEIIKEVQATRSQSAGLGPHQNSNLNQPVESQDERAHIEQVYEDLVKCVGQFEEELRASGSGTEQLPARAGSGPPAGQMACYSLQSAHQPATNFTTNNFSGTNQAAFYSYPHQSQHNQQNPSRPSRQNNHSICSNDDASFAASQRPAPPETGCRPRVTSFGSANQKYAAASYCQQPLASSRYNPYPSEHARSVSCRTKQEMYLAPSDKSWQKSCSDPTLHVPCAPIVNALSCSDHLLSASEIQQQQQQQQTLSLAPPQNGASTNRKQQLYEPDYNDCGGQHLAELPNIQICNIDDELQVPLPVSSGALPPEVCTADSSGLPDLRSLQFSNSPPSYAAGQPYQQSAGELPAREQLCASLSSSGLPADGGGLVWLANGKAGNLLSGSERGLGAAPNQQLNGSPHVYTNGNGSGPANSIMRSQSHSCIDHLRKGRPARQQPNNETQNLPPTTSNIPTNSYRNQYQSQSYVQWQNAPMEEPQADYRNYPAAASQFQAQPASVKYNGTGSGLSNCPEAPLSSTSADLNNEYQKRRHADTLNQADLVMDESSSSSSCPPDQPYRMAPANFGQAPEAAAYAATSGELLYGEQMFEYSLPPE